MALTDPYDPSSADTAAGFQYAFDFGNGYGAYSSSNTASFTPTDDGIRTVLRKIRDKDSGVTEYSATVTVNNVAPTTAVAPSYDAASDFSVAANPHGTWSYGYAPSLHAAPVLYDQAFPDWGSRWGVTGLQAWSSSNVGIDPNVSVNTSNTPVWVEGRVVWGPGQMLFHPGPSGRYSIVRFTAPQTGVYWVEATFTGATRGLHRPMYTSSKAKPRRWTVSSTASAQAAGLPSVST